MTATQRVDVARLSALIATYWDLGYAEGREGRTHDTCHADAAACWSEIDAILQQLAERDAEIERLTLESRTTWQQNATLREGVAPLHAKLAAAERAREEAVRAVNWYADNQSMVTECNGKWFAVVGNRDEVAQCDNGLDAIVAAFLAANAPTHSAGGE